MVFQVSLKVWGVLAGLNLQYKPYLESQWPLRMGYVVGYFGVWQIATLGYLALKAGPIGRKTMPAGTP